MRRLRRNRFRQSEEMNITAFMNLMVILVPFLLITTVFSRLVILELNLPTSSKHNASSVPKQALQLEIVVRKDRLEVGDNGKPPAVLKNKQQAYNLSGLRELLKAIKAEFPDKISAAILMEADIPYESLVEVMDIVRMVQVNTVSGTVQAELFPDISIGDAPLLQNIEAPQSTAIE